MSVLTVVQDAMALCGLPRPTIVVGGNNPTVAQFEALLRFEATELNKYKDWRNLKVQGQLTGDGTSTEFVLPVDFDRWALGEVFFTSGLTGAYLPQVTDEQWTAMRAGGFTLPAYPGPFWRMFGTMVQFSSAPILNDTLDFEYRSNFWISSEDQTARRNRWADDTDFFLMPEDILTLGCVWRFKNAKGLEYAEDYRNWQMQRNTYAAQDEPRIPIRKGTPSRFGANTRIAYPWTLG